MGSSGDPVGARTEAALAGAGYADMRPTYRVLLRRLKDLDAAGYEEATTRYREVLVPSIATEDGDAVAAWTGYGLWLARRLTPGRLVRIDASGLATDIEDASPMPGEVLLFLPDIENESAILILQPAEPSDAQRSALHLLVR